MSRVLSSVCCTVTVALIRTVNDARCLRWVGCKTRIQLRCMQQRGSQFSSDSGHKLELCMRGCASSIRPNATPSQRHASASVLNSPSAKQRFVRCCKSNFAHATLITRFETYGRTSKLSWCHKLPICILPTVGQRLWQSAMSDSSRTSCLLP